jgi:hypothetical protein
MSATLPNLDLLSKWLDADLYKTDFRPVPLSEHIKIGDTILNNKFELVRNLNPLVQLQNDTDHLVYLSLETVINGHSVLVFCPTKNWCETLADTVAKEFFNLGKPRYYNTERRQLKLKMEQGRIFGTSKLSHATSIATSFRNFWNRVTQLLVVVLAIQNVNKQTQTMDRKKTFSGHLKNLTKCSRILPKL